jgi:hypothetical protein
VVRVQVRVGVLKSRRARASTSTTTHRRRQWVGQGHVMDCRTDHAPTGTTHAALHAGRPVQG